MKYLVFALIGLALLFGCAGNAPKNQEATQPQAMEPPGSPQMNEPPPANPPAPPSEAPPQPPAAAPPPVPPPVVEPDVVRVDVTASNYAYNPSTITVKKGSRVRISVTSLDKAYGFAIMDFGVNEIVPAKESVVVSFLANKAGTFEIKNTHITSGAAYGMKGTLIVEE